jgi:hypothetical protein
MSIVVHVSGNGSRELAQLIGSKRHIRLRSSFDPFVLFIKPVEWLTDGFLWLIECLVKYLMGRVGRLAVALLSSGQIIVLLLVLLKEHLTIND